MLCDKLVQQRQEASTNHQERCLVSNSGQAEQMQDQHPHLLQAAPIAWQSTHDVVAAEI